MSATDAWPMTVLDVFKNYLNFLKSQENPSFLFHPWNNIP